MSRASTISSAVIGCTGIYLSLIFVIYSRQLKCSWKRKTLVRVCANSRLVINYFSASEIYLSSYYYRAKIVCKRNVQHTTSRSTTQAQFFFLNFSWMSFLITIWLFPFTKVCVHVCRAFAMFWWWFQTLSNNISAFGLGHARPLMHSGIITHQWSTTKSSAAYWSAMGN